MNGTRIECGCGVDFVATGWTGEMLTVAVLWKLHLHDGCVAVLIPGLADPLPL